jgi:hypothetical protein
MPLLAFPEVTLAAAYGPAAVSLTMALFERLDAQPIERVTEGVPGEHRARQAEPGGGAIDLGPTRLGSSVIRTVFTAAPQAGSQRNRRTRHRGVSTGPCLHDVTARSIPTAGQWLVV